jgi:hypothetical protein
MQQIQDNSSRCINLSFQIKLAPSQSNEYFFIGALSWHRRLHLSGLDELPLLDVDGLCDDLVPRHLGLHQLEPVKVGESGPPFLGRHALGPRGLRPLGGDLIVGPGLADDFAARGERELKAEVGQVQALDPVLLTGDLAAGAVDQNLKGRSVAISKRQQYKKTIFKPFSGRCIRGACSGTKN